ncbi:dienelactone hydrolase [Paraburkholderia youngii]|uniref:Dienelactone hydrolase n=1 Tax=Paraburkholderia youngii TaxID=2782701 RepID=A0A7W8L094_9BURK|nr:dienelactone hydrolase [Paraburkholderia youngii]
MPYEKTIVRTDDGDCNIHVFSPIGPGPCPGVIFYMDAGGVRPAVLDMAGRLADSGIR